MKQFKTNMLERRAAGSLKNRTTSFLYAAALLLLALGPLILSSYSLSLLIQILIFGLLAMSLNLLVGYTGLFSFNHASFFGVGAYAVGILYFQGIHSFWLLLPLGIAISALLAALLGLVILRSSGPYFFMLTLAFGQMVFAVAWKWRSLTGGDDGLPGIPRPETGLPLSFWDNRAYYFLVLLAFLGSFLLLRRITRSRFGLALRGIREGEGRMQALGYNTWAVKYAAYVLAGAFGALAGVLHVFYNGFISPSELNWTMSGMVMLMVIIGGCGRLAGPVVGAGVILLLQNFISAYTERWPFFIGVIFILCVMYARNGIAGFAAGLWEKGWERYESARNQKPR